MGEFFIPYTEQEEDALEALGDHSAEVLYRRLRRSMDWRTRTVGRITPISHGGLMLRMKQFTTRGRGVQEHLYTKDVLRSDIKKLVKAGLLVRIGNDEALCFLCPLARDNSARSRQTPHIPTTQLSTEQTTPEASIGAGSGGYYTSPIIRQLVSNAPYIKGVDVYTPQSSSTDSTGVDASDASAAGVNRDRAAPSQASSAYCRSGNPNEPSDRDRPSGSYVGPLSQSDFDAESNRDRALPSHPAPSRRSASPAPHPAAPAEIGGHEPPDCSAAKDLESRSDGAPPPHERAKRDVLAGVVARRGIRVAEDDAFLAQWVAWGVTEADVGLAIDKSVQARMEAGSMDPIPIKYVHRVIQSQRSKARKAAARSGGEQAGLEAMARAVGMWPGPAGWSWERLAAEVRARWHAGQGTANG